MQPTKTHTIVAKRTSDHHYTFTIPAEMIKDNSRVVVQFPDGQGMILAIQPQQGLFTVEQPVEARDLSVSFG